MIFHTETSEQWHERNRACLAEWEKKDAPKLLKIRAQWEYECEWHRKFAWFPVKVCDGKIAWLQTVERRLTDRTFPRIMASWHVRSFEYREKKS